MNRYTSYVVGLLGFIFLFLAIDIYYKYQQFSDYHKKISEKTVSSTGAEIEQILLSEKRRLDLFADQEQELLTELYLAPNNPIKQQSIKTKIDKYFPDMLEYSIADSEGNIRLNQEAFEVYSTCRQNIIQMAEHGKPALLNIHNRTNTKKQHYDLMVQLPNRSIFFISYHIDPIIKLLAKRQSEHHWLFVVNRQKSSQLEFIHPATFQELEHSDMIQTAAEFIASNTLVETGESARIQASDWIIVDQLDPDSRSSKIISLLIQHSIVMVLFIVLSVVFLMLMRKEVTNNSNTRILLKGVEDERKRISMDLHDQILADITHLSRKVSATEIVDSKNINAQLLLITRSIRNVIEDLHPNSLDLLGIEATLQNYVKKNACGGGLPAYSIKIPEEVDSLLEPYQRYTVYRILVELVNNIINHAQCSSYSVTTNYNNSMITFKISDNGIGLDKNSGHRTSLGLNNIKSRCQMLGAAFSLSDNVPSGTLITLSLNIPSHSAG